MRGYPSERAYSGPRDRHQKVVLRPNVTFRSRQPDSSEKTKKKKFTLADMIKNAKKVEKEVGEPILDGLRDEGHLPSTTFDEIEESVYNKVDSFMRGLDYPFTREFGRAYENRRQEAWEKAKRDERKNPFYVNLAPLSGFAFDAPEEYILRSRMDSSTFVRQGPFRVALPTPICNWYDYNAYETSAIKSGLMPGRVSDTIVFLKYQTTYESDEDVREYINELDELKHIYRAFWFLSRINRKNWIKCLYKNPEEKVVDYRLPRFNSPDGLRRSEETVIFNVEGTDCYLSVDELYEWIEHYRLPRKKYAIGECESEIALCYAIYLNYMYGISKDIIKQYLTIELMEEVKYHMSALNLGLQMAAEADAEEDSEARKALGVVSLDIEARPAAVAAEAFEAKWMYKSVNFSDGIIDLSQLDDGEDDSVISEDDIPSVDEEFPGADVELPYETNLHASNNEFEAFFFERNIPEEDTRANDEEIIDALDSDNESICSENMPDKELNPLDELGVDLIDPSRDTIDQPTIKRIGLVWDPGKGAKANSKRFVKTLGVKQPR